MDRAPHPLCIALLLMLLSTAWSGTIQASQLQLHVTNIQGQITKMQGWWASFANAAALNTLVEPLIAQYAPTITDAARLTSPWYYNGNQGSSYPSELKGCIAGALSSKANSWARRSKIA